MPARWWAWSPLPMPTSPLQRKPAMTVVNLKSPEPGSGTSMDRAVTTTRMPRRTRIAIAATALAIIIAAAAWAFNGSANSQTVETANLTIATVTRGTFDDFVPLRARVTPLVTVYLDAVEGGRIDRILTEDGATVAAGQPLAMLSNATLQLDVIAREADVSQQLNNLRSQELELQRSRLENRRNLGEVDWQMQKDRRAHV